MATLGLIFTCITSVMHLFFFVLETFFWTKPLGLRIFRQNLESALVSQQLAANQGVYNALLGVGLLYSLTFSNPAVQGYCLSYIVVVGFYGAYSLRSAKVLLFQAAPALAALVCYYL